MDHRRAYLLLALVIVFWAGNYPLGKLALAELGPLTLTGARTLLAVPLLLLVGASPHPCLAPSGGPTTSPSWSSASAVSSPTLLSGTSA